MCIFSRYLHFLKFRNYDPDKLQRKRLKKRRKKLDLTDLICTRFGRKTPYLRCRINRFSFLFSVIGVLRYVEKIIWVEARRWKFLSGYRARNSKFHLLPRKQTFMMKILVWAKNKWNKLKFFKKSFPPGSPGLFSEMSFLQKIIFIIKVCFLANCDISSCANDIYKLST